MEKSELPDAIFNNSTIITRPMNVGLILLFEIFFIIAVVILLFSIFVQDSDRDVMKEVLLKGAVGWGVAFFLRLLPVVLVQRYIIFLLGGSDDPASILEYSRRMEVAVVGPIFAGIFEEVVRFFTIKRSPNIGIDRRVGPLVSGLGWGLGEVVVLFGLNALAYLLSGATSPINFGDIFVALLERFSAFIFHIAMSYVIYYSLFEVGKLRPSVLVAIILHFLFNFIIVIWSTVIFDIFSPSNEQFLWGLELSLLAAAVIVALFVWKIAIPRGERLWKESRGGMIPSVRESVGENMT